MSTVWADTPDPLRAVTYVQVTDVDTTADDHGLSVRVTLRRSAGYPLGPQPRAEDVPGDIRQALREWLS